MRWRSLTIWVMKYLPRILFFAFIATVSRSHSALITDEAMKPPTKVLGFGLKIKQEFGRIQIVGFLPSSPAANASGIQVGDEIVGVAPGNDDTAFIALTNLPMEKVRSLLSTSVGTTLRLKLRQSTEANSPERIVALTASYYELPYNASIKRTLIGVKVDASEVRELSREEQADLEAETAKAISSAFTQGSAVHREGDAFTSSFQDPTPVRTATNKTDPRSPISHISWRPSQRAQPTVVLPSDTWEFVTNGISRSAALSLLGAPQSSNVTSSLAAGHARLIYGWLRFDCDALPVEYTFSLYFVGERLLSKLDPFEGRWSRDGKPTTPVPLLPTSNAVFSHFPRFVDLRWTPSAGKYPLDYVVQVDYSVEAGEWAPTEEQATAPYYCLAFRGMNRGRWRVRAKNSLGESAWSDFRYFQFDR